MESLWADLWRVPTAAETMILAVLVALVLRDRRLRGNMREMVAKNNEILTTCLGLLKTVRGWAVVIESKEEAKLVKLQEVADIAAQTTVQITRAIEKAVVTTAQNVTDSIDPTAEKVVQKIEQKASGLSDQKLGPVSVRPAMP